MVLSANDKQRVREDVKKQIEALKKKVKPTEPPKEPEVEEGEEE